MSELTFQSTKRAKLGALRLLRISLLNVLRRGRRSAITLAAISFGVVSLLIAGGFIGWVLSEMRELSIRTWYGHVQVARSGYWERGAADPGGHLVTPPPELINRLETDPRVEAVAPRLTFAALISHGESTIPMLGEGVDPMAQIRFGRALIFLPGRGEDLSPADPKGVVIGQGLAANLGVKPGDKVVLLATTLSGGVNAIEVRIRGMFLTANKAFDDSTLRLPLPLAQELLRTQGIHSWTILLKDSADAQSLTRELASVGAPDGLAVRPWTTLAETYLRTEALFGRQLSAMALVLGMLIVLGISNTMTMSVMERTGEIGTAMALGATSRQVLAQFVVEGAMLGTVGGAIGVFVGVLLAWLLSWVGIPLPPPPGLDTPIVAAIRVDLPLVLQTLLVAIASTVLASTYPALRASRLLIVDALRHAHA